MVIFDESSKFNIAYFQKLMAMNGNGMKRENVNVSLCMLDITC